MLADLHKHRLSNSKVTHAMPNYEKEYAKQKLKNKLYESQAARRTTANSNSNNSNNEEQKSNSSNNNSSSGGSVINRGPQTSRTKVLKKPVPNFGGGKVGTK